MIKIREYQYRDYNKMDIFQATNFLKKLREKGEEIKFSKREKSSSDFNFSEVVDAEYRMDGIIYKVDGSTNRKGSNLRITVKEYK